MKTRWLLPILAAALTAETAALACSCVAPGTPEQSRPYAREAVQRAVAIVEAEVLSEYRPGGPGELVRVRRTLWGQAPTEFRIARVEFASSASCDLLLAPGETKVLILYDPADAPHLLRGDATPKTGTLAIQSLCSDFLVSDRGYLDITLDEARRRGPPAPIGERG